MASAASVTTYTLLQQDLDEMTPEPAHTLNGYQLLTPTPELDDINHFHNQESEIFPSQNGCFNEERANKAIERTSNGIANQQQKFMQSPVYGACSSTVINSQPRRRSLFIAQPIKIKQGQDLMQKNKSHKLLDPYCDASPSGKQLSTGLSSLLIGGLSGCALATGILKTYFAPPAVGSTHCCTTLGYEVGIYLGINIVCCASAALIIGCSIYQIGNILKKIPVREVDSLLNKLNKKVSKHDKDDLTDPRFPKELKSVNRTASLRDPVFICNYSHPISARQFIQCLRNKTVLPSGKVARTEQLVIGKLTESQSKKLSHLKKAFELWDAKQINELTKYIEDIQTEERFW